MNRLGDRVNKVGAGAAALAALHPLDFDPDDKWDAAAGFGNYRNANAGAVGIFYRPNEDTMVSVGGSFGNGENMINAGVSFKLGQGNHVSTSRVAMAKELKDDEGCSGAAGGADCEIDRTGECDGGSEERGRHRSGNVPGCAGKPLGV